MPSNKCIIILSNMCSGSSACQNLLSRFPHVHHIARTRHFEYETQYWIHAASILKLPLKIRALRKIPLKPEYARRELKKLLKDNLVDYVLPEDDKEMIFEGWKHLCERFGPVFIEKTPQHLFQWSAVELIIECMEQLGDIDFLIIGLVRNPMDTFYSEFRRWKSPPEPLQQEWFVAYQNLLKLKGLLGQKVVIIRYEDMVSSLQCMQPVFDFIGINIDEADKGYLHKKSIQKWRNNRLWGFTLSEELIVLAERFGYRRDEMITGTKGSKIWPAYRDLSWQVYKYIYPLVIKYTRLKRKIQRERG